ncbi:hypothetical protein P7F88_19320 [Vibrio hannami]|uniref:hypothetical protein n=1 Tax=Vibrio hannami TaxID=2717094 RepID=UPI00240FA299|nr:hypothetical protein [Vibrio hannami]MDG3088107.1 hypothetical protein [Vibrio hannami]
MITFLTAIGTGILNLVSARQAEKSRKAERKDRVEEAKATAQIKRIESGDNNAARLDEISMKDRGWKDDYLLLLTTIPVLLAFVPDWAPYIQQGFDALEASVPEYYWYALGMIYIDTFGFRRMLRVAFEHWLSKRFGGANGSVN